MVIQTGLKLHLRSRRKLCMLGIGKVIYINKSERLFNLGWPSIYYTLFFDYFVINVARQLDNIQYDSGVYQSNPENPYGLHNDQVITIFIIDLQ